MYHSFTTTCLRPDQRLDRGLTLIELMITLSLMSLLLMLAVPGMQAMMASSRLTSATNELSATLARARSESMRYGTRMTVCKADGSGLQCSTEAGTGWEAGWLAFRDPIRSVSPLVDAGETVTFRIEPLAAGLKINGNSGLANYVSYAADGRSKTISNNGLLMGRIRICSTSSALGNDARARDLVVSASGRVALEKPLAIAASCPPP